MKYLLILISYISFGQASNQMVTYTQASTLGFTLNSGQSHVTSNECITKAQAFAKYNLATTANTNTVASNQLLRRDYWVTGVTAYSFVFGESVEWEVVGGTNHPVGIACGVTTNPFTLYSSSATLTLSTLLYVDSNLTTLYDGYGFENYHIASNNVVRWDRNYGEIAIIATCSSDTTPPTNPSSLNSSLYSSTEVILNWTASTDNVGVSAYEIYRSTTSSTTGFSYIGEAYTNNYYDTSAAPETTYWYRVRAYDAAGNLSGYSNVVSQYTFN